MKFGSHQVMGYDRAITMFSPDGRLLQVEYAKKTVRQGTTMIGMVCKDGVLIVADKRIMDKLMVPEGVEKIYKIDDHMAAAFAGLASDARLLVDRAQIRAQQNKVSYDQPIDVITVVRDVSDIKQMCTQSGGLRPFGVSLIFAGIDEGGPCLYVTEPSGIYFKYYATAIGEGEVDATEVLNNEYKQNISVDDGIKLGLKALKKVLGTNYNLDRVEAAYIKAAEKPIFVRLEGSQLKKFEK